MIKIKSNFIILIQKKILPYKKEKEKKTASSKTKGNSSEQG